MSNSTLQLAIVVSDFNQEITEPLLQGALAHLTAQQITAKQITVVNVPGAIEIPLTAKLLAQTKKYQAIICLGSVIRGDTDHYDYVCQQVSHGCQQVMLQFDLPIIFGVLTTQNLHQAQARAGGREGNKGQESAAAALAMIDVLQKLKRDDFNN